MDFFVKVNEIDTGADILHNCPNGKDISQQIRISINILFQRTIAKLHIDVVVRRIT